MDTLSSSVSTIKVPTFHSTASSRELCNFKSTSTLYTPNSLLFSTPKSISSTNSISTKPNSFNNPISPSPSRPSSPSYSAIHRKASAGYAAALLDIAQHNNSVDLVGKDVERLSKLLKNNRVRVVLSDPFLGEEEKGRLVKGLVKKGGFNRHLVRLVKMLVGKNKVGLLGEVLEEFDRVYDEVLGTQMVLVSSKSKMEEEHLSGIARRIQKLTGAVKVKVRNLIGVGYHHNWDSFAV
ncbi:ATP synthase subunit delta, chloroplastic-like [Humulus lupulus]|uniref:ATP synthase subunit delta, chloroplastic-like n=1 Tax=Humulus lupulus TaxID=3486 RepID=UPI002B403B4B|nr:ATP synthase subunit delta, chloroplastic-like [Humulus lupulus]